MPSTADPAGSPTPPVSTPTPTSPSPDDELAQLRREVERDFLRNQALLSSIASRPRERNLEAQLRQVVVPQSELFEFRLENYLAMIAEGHRIQLGDPPVARDVVELVEFSGEAPHREAIVTYCHVDNANLVAVAPNGDVSIVGAPQGLAASRLMVPMRLTADGWKEYEVVDSTIGFWEGAGSCPDE